MRVQSRLVRIGLLALTLVVGGGGCANDTEGDTSDDSGPVARGDAGVADLGRFTGQPDVGGLGGTDTGVRAPTTGVTPTTDFVPNEIEPNESWDPHEVTLPAEIRGTIGPAEGDDFLWPDDDAFEFTVSAGTLVRLTLSQVGHDLEPDIRVYHTGFSADREYVRTLDTATEGATRQIFLPHSGSYRLEVSDIRNQSYPTEPYGGLVGYEYEIKVEIETPQAIAQLLPFGYDYTDLGATMPVRYHDIAVFEAGVLLVSVSARSLDPPSDVLPSLYLTSAGASELLASSAADQSNDPYLAYEVHPGDHLWVIVDYLWAGANNAYEIDFELVDAAVEREPNDGADRGWPLAIGASLEEAAWVMGALGEPEDAEDGGQQGDFDWYALGYLPRSHSLVVEVEPTVDSPAQLAVFVGAQTEDTFGIGSFEVTFFSNPDPSGATRLEVTTVAEGEHFVFLADRRNLPPLGAGDDWVLREGVGGDEFSYHVRVGDFELKPTTVDELPLDVDGVLGLTGEVDWYTLPELDATNASFLGVQIGRRSDDQDSGLTDAAEVVAYVFETDPDGGVGPFLGSFSEGVPGSLEVEPKVAPMVAVWNAAAWSDTPPAYDLHVSLLRVPSAPSARIEDIDFASDPPETVSADNTAYLGKVDGTTEETADEDTFALDLSAGDVLVAYTYPALGTRRYECGDGFLDADETCDDRNQADRDGCDRNCVLEELFENRCGDGVIAGTESCDLGANNGGGSAGSCSSSCVAGVTADTLLVLSQASAPTVVILEDDDGGEGVFSKIVYTVPDDGAGIYHVTVRPYCSSGLDSCSAGLYRLHIARLTSE